MTDWNKLGVGPQCDLVAEHVMGLEWHLVRGYRQWTNGGNPISFGISPRYLHDMGLAWLVVERMREKGWGYSMFTASPFSSMMHGCLVAFTQSVYPVDCTKLDARLSAHAPTASEAICLAALRAVGVEV